MPRLIALLALVFALSACSMPGHLDNTPAQLPVELAAPKRVVVVGDSYTAGTELGGQKDNNWAAIAFGQLASTDREVLINPVIAAQGGAGYAKEGEDGSRFLQKIGPVLLPGDDLVVFFGSRNDTEVPIELVQPAVHQTLGQTRSIAPKAKILVIGPAWAGGNPPPTAYAVRDIMKAEAALIRADFVDPLAEEWLYDPSLVGPDGIHPNDAGHAFLAAKIAPLVAEELKPPLTQVS